jgi:hypothetical protein
MKKIRNKILLGLIAFGLMTATACLKLPNPTKEEVTTTKKFTDIKTSPSFNWGTTRKVNVNILGLITPNPITGTLKLSHNESGAIHYRGTHSLSETLSMNIEIPIAQDSMRLTFGSISKVYSVSGTEINMDYVIDYPEN